VLMKQAAHGQLPAAGTPAQGSTPALESPCTAALLRTQALRSLSRELKPNASRQPATSRAWLRQRWVTARLQPASSSPSGRGPGHS